MKVMRTKIHLLILCISAILLVAIYCNLPTRLDLHSISLPVELKISRLVYLVQAESCLPKYLASPEVIGNSSNCNCDVLVLSYKKKCNDTSLPHVEYVFNSSTTWTTGRNLLYELVMRRDETYFYYIFMDDDIELTCINVTNEKNKTHQLWRAFESSLKSIEPAVGIVDILQNLKSLYSYRRAMKCTNNRTDEYLPTVFFDPAFNAFHYKAVQYLLPYSARFDNITWYYSHLHVNIKCELMFRGQVVQHTYIIAKNTKHRKYKRKGYTDKNNIVQMINDAIKMFPKQYQNTTLVKERKKHGRQHERNSSTLCLPPPKPHAPIVPFAWTYMKHEA